MLLQVRKFLLPSGGKGYIPCRMEDILREIDAALERLGLSARAASIRAQGTPETIRDMRRGHIPSVERLRSLCEVLDLEFHVGPRRVRTDAREGAPGVLLSTLERTAQDLARLTVEAGGNPVPDDLWPALAAGRASLVSLLGSENAPADWRTYDATPSFGALRKPRKKSRGLTVNMDIGSVDKRWMMSGLDLFGCFLLEVGDEFMEPAIPKGCTVLVDGARIDWEPPRVMAVRIDDDVIARRAALDDDGQRLLASDDPAWPDVPLPAGAEILGQVRWVLKSVSRATSDEDRPETAPAPTTSRAEGKLAG